MSFYPDEDKSLRENQNIALVNIGCLQCLNDKNLEENNKHKEFIIRIQIFKKNFCLLAQEINRQADSLNLILSDTKFHNFNQIKSLTKMSENLQFFIQFLEQQTEYCELANQLRKNKNFLISQRYQCVESQIQSKIRKITNKFFQNFNFQEFQQLIEKLLALKQFKEQLRQSSSKERSMLWINRAQQVGPKTSEGLFFLGNSLFELNSLNIALQLYDKALCLNSENPTILFKKGLTLYLMERYEEAVIEFKKAIKIKPYEANVLNQLGFTLAKINKYHEAIYYFDQAIYYCPNFLEPYHIKGNTLNLLGKHQEAILCFDQALNINKDNHLAYYYKGNSLLNLQFTNEAIQFFDKAIELNSTHFDSYNSKELALRVLERVEESIICLDEALKLNPNCEQIIQNRSASLSILKYKQEGIEHPFQAFYGQSLSLAEQEELKEAISCFDKVIQMDPKNLKAHKNKVKSLQMLLSSQKETTSYNKTLEELRKTQLIVEQLQIGEK